MAVETQNPSSAKTALENKGPGTYHTPITVDELTQRNVEVVARLDEAAQSRRTPTDHNRNGSDGKTS